jgi:hypothetical protein
MGNGGRLGETKGQFSVGIAINSVMKGVSGIVRYRNEFNDH